jgi:hypothetical protein
MGITYYPDDVDKKLLTVAEQQQQPNTLYSIFGTGDLSVGGGLSANIWCPKTWEVKRVNLHFPSTSSNNYSISVVRGIGVLTGKNDRLWVKVDGVQALPVIVPQGFYIGSQMASALVTAIGTTSIPSQPYLTAVGPHAIAAPNPFSYSFPLASLPFTVDYGNTNPGKFTFTPAGSKNVQIFYQNPSTGWQSYSSIATALGFTTDSAMTTPVVSDTAVLGLGTSMSYLSGVSTSNQDVMSTDTVALTTDNLLNISASLVTPTSGTVTYEVVYKLLDV